MSGSETGSDDQAAGNVGAGVEGAGGDGGGGGGGDAGGGGGGSGGAGGGGGDLASRLLVLESKRFYLDVKENPRGRFIKIAEISVDGRKNQILMNLPTAAQFREHLVSMIQFYQTLDAVDPDNLTHSELRSEAMFKEDKKYRIDLKVGRRSPAKGLVLAFDI